MKDLRDLKVLTIHDIQPLYRGRRFVQRPRQRSGNALHMRPVSLANCHGSPPEQIVLCQCLGVYHKPPDSGECQHKLRPCERLFGPAPRTGGLLSPPYVPTILPFVGASDYLIPGCSKFSFDARCVLVRRHRGDDLYLAPSK